VSVWILGMATALAQAPTVDRTKQFIGTREAYRVEVAFTIEDCHRFKATFRDPRDPDEATTDDLRIVLINKTGETCWFQGLALSGTLKGTFTPTPLPPKGLGLMLPADKPLALDLQPEVGPRVHPVIQLFIPPGRGVLMLHAEPPPPPPEPEPEPEPDPETTP